MMQPEDSARLELWDRLCQSVDAHKRLAAMTDLEIADLLLKVWGEKETFSLEETLLSHVRERLQRANLGPMPEEVA